MRPGTGLDLSLKDANAGRANGLDVLVDLTPLDTPSRFRGIGRYTIGLAGGLAELAAAGELDLRIEGLIRNGFGSRPLTDPTLRYAGDPRLRPTEWQSWRYKMVRRLTMGSLAAGAGARLLHLTDPKGTPWDGRVPRIVTCHDLIPLVMHREYLPVPGARTERLVRDRTRYRTAVRVIAISEATRRDAVFHLGLDPDRVDVVYHGVDHQRFRRRPEAGEEQRVRALLGRGDPFLLYLGGADRRKRLPLLIRAFARAQCAPEVVLVIAGALNRQERRELTAAARKAGIAGRLVLPGYVAESLVPALYRSCLGHVFPSVYEGFGLPVLEALACGAPTVTTLETALAEVAGDAALAVPADEEEALAAAIRRLCEDSGLRRELSARGPSRARMFTWRRCAAETLQSYRRALEETDRSG